VKRCLDDETIQRLLDDELSTPSRRLAEAHLGECPSCFEMLRAAEREEAFIASFFAPQLFGGVPTERLWLGIHDALRGARSTARCK